jgi:hypothetical protein
MIALLSEPLERGPPGVTHGYNRLIYDREIVVSCPRQNRADGIAVPTLAEQLSNIRPL